MRIPLRSDGVRTGHLGVGSILLFGGLGIAFVAELELLGFGLVLVGLGLLIWAFLDIPQLRKSGWPAGSEGES